MEDGDWGPFGRPIFEDEAARALSRVGVVDVGSNSVRLVVFDGAARSPAYFYNEKVMAALGKGLGETGRLNPEGRERTLAAMRRFKLLADAMGISPLSTVATAAMRDAEDGPELRAEIERETGVKLWVIDGREEARLTAQGVLLGWPGTTGLVCDIGGSSMEMAELNEGRVGRRETSDLGPLKIASEGDAKGRRKAIRAGLERLSEAVPPGPGRLYLVGGSWRAIARIDMERTGYPLHVLHEYRMDAKAVEKTVAFVGEHSTDDLRAMTGIGEARMSLVPLACEVLAETVKVYEPAEIVISAYGIREGLLYEEMPAKLRERDPLIEACRYDEQRSARMPGFGKTLFEFLLPLYEDCPHEELRLVKAACLLHDVSWRAHPDYRAEVCFDNVTRASITGIDHKERVFIGAALAHRYKNSRPDSLDAVVALLSEERLARAEVLGKAMRFGAMLSVSGAGRMGALDWDADARVLTFTMDRQTRGLFGEVAEARLMALGKALDADVVTKVGD